MASGKGSVKKRIITIISEKNIFKGNIQLA